MLGAPPLGQVPSPPSRTACAPCVARWHYVMRRTRVRAAPPSDKREGPEVSLVDGLTRRRGLAGGATDERSRTRGVATAGSSGVLGARATGAPAALGAGEPCRWLDLGAGRRRRLPRRPDRGAGRRGSRCRCDWELVTAECDRAPRRPTRLVHRVRPGRPVDRFHPRALPRLPGAGHPAPGRRHRPRLPPDRRPGRGDRARRPAVGDPHLPAVHLAPAQLPSTDDQDHRRGARRRVRGHRRADRGGRPVLRGGVLPGPLVARVARGLRGDGPKRPLAPGGPS